MAFTIRDLSSTGNFEKFDAIAAPYLWYTHPVDQMIANNVWTPLAWNSPSNVDHNDAHTGLVGATTIAAGSNGQALPFGTINVASTASFQSAGYICVRIGAADTVVKYTGKNSTQFTGCTLGSGTLLTAQAVAEANVNILCQDLFHTSIAEAGFAANGTGGRAIRFKSDQAPFFFTGAQFGPVATVAGEICHVQVMMQPGGLSPNTIDVKQTSGGPLAVVVDGIASPSIMSCPIGVNLLPGL